MKIIVFGIMAIALLAITNIQNSYGHNPDFEVSSSEDILKFCEFFYDEYQLLGVDPLVEQHSYFPNLRACVILYNHVAWNSTHEAREIVLISEIDKYLGNSSYIKERYIEYSDTMPDWIKKEARLWVNGENQDIGFAYGVRTLLEAGVITLDHKERECVENQICVKENDFMKYSHVDKYGNNISIKHVVKSIKNNEPTVNNSEITVEVEKVSQGGVERKEIILNEKGVILSKDCCAHYEFIIPLPIKLGDSISENEKIIAETTYMLDNEIRLAWFASDMTGQNVRIIDKKTGLIFSYEFHETEVLTVGEETKIKETNFFDTKYDMESHQVAIPKWWKITTSWLLDGRISESEYLRALENLISRNILTV